MISCGKCWQILPENENTTFESRKPCHNCSSLTRIFSESIAADVKASFQINLEGVMNTKIYEKIHTLDSIRIKHKSKATKKVYEEFQGWQLWKIRNEYVYKLRIIDPQNNFYKEHITCMNGTIIHEVEELLSQHRGHGSAKKILT